jgi:hypothetical protein
MDDQQVLNAITKINNTSKQPPGLNLKAQTKSTATAHFNFEKALLSSVPSISGAEKNLQ